MATSRGYKLESLGTTRQNDHPNLPMHIVKVSVRQLLQQTRYLAVQTPQVQVPEEVLRVARRALEARKKCREEYETLLSGMEDRDFAIAKSNEGHGYFIIAIETILEILKPRFKPSEDLSGKTEPSLRSSTPANIFELLEVYDCLDEDIATFGNPMTSALMAEGTNDKPEPHELETTPEPLHNQRSWRVQAFYAIEKIQDIQRHVQSIWQEYLGGKIDMMVASFVTEISFQLIERIEHDEMFFTVDGETIGSFDCALEALDMFTTKEYPLEFREYGPFCEWNEHYFLRFKLDIDMRLEKLLRDTERLRKDFGNYNPSSDRNAMTDIEKWQENGWILNNIIGDTFFANWVSATSSNLAREYTLGKCDSFTTALAEMGKKKAKETASLATCAQAQILMDIHLVLREHVTRPCKQLKLVVILSRKITEDYRKFFEKPIFSILGGEAWGADCDGKLNQVIPSIEGDRLGKRKSRHSELEKGDFQIIPDAPFSQNPVLCGLNSLRIYAHLQKEGLRSADNWWFIMPVAHLYNALKQLGYIEKPWKRMEQFFEIHGWHYIFNGTAPINLETCHSKIRTCCGYSATTGTNDQKPPRIRSRPRRNLKPNPSPISELLQKHILDDHSGLITSLHRLHLTQQITEASPSSEGPRYTSFLNFIKTQLSSELKHLKFDYFALNEECIKVLHALLVGFAKLFRAFGMSHYDDSVGNEARCMRDIVPDLPFFAAKGWESKDLLEGGTSVPETCGFILGICVGTSRLGYEAQKHLWESKQDSVWGK